MARRRSPEIPEPILLLQQQLDQWRAAQKGRAKLPESFWQSAVDLARRFGIFRTAQPLRLDYTRLKQRLNSAVPQHKSAPPASVELVRPHPATMEECVVEFESAQGAKMRVQWRSSVPPDWTSLLRAWRDGDR
jgi:hypothetical protein